MSELELSHYGIKGQKYGVRRWQYKDGSLTPEGYIHYGYGRKRKASEHNGTVRSNFILRSKPIRASSNKSVLKENSGAVESNKEKSSNRFEVNLSDKQKQNLKTALMVGAAVAVTAGAMYYAKNRAFYDGEWLATKKLSDFTLEEGRNVQTLARSADRLKTGDMFYGSHTKLDNAFYRTAYSVDFKNILEGKSPPPKYLINTHLAKNIRVASEKSSADVFARLYKDNDAVKSFVNDPSKMRDMYLSRAPKKFSGYKEALEALDRVSSSKNPSDKDLRLVYRLFNYVIPNRKASEVRGMFFSSLKDAGYGGVLDTNDALYGGFHSKSPVIIFDMEHVVTDSAKQVRARDIPASAIELAIEKLKLVDTSAVYK